MFDIFFILAYNAPEKTETVKNIHFHDGYLFFQSIPCRNRSLRLYRSGALSIRNSLCTLRDKNDFKCIKEDPKVEKN